MFENVDRRTLDGRRSHWYTISSYMSLQLRWAKNISVSVANSVDPDQTALTGAI